MGQYPGEKRKMMTKDKIPGVALTTEQKKERCPILARGEIPTCVKMCFFCPQQGQ